MGSFLASPIGSWLRVFVATVLTVLLADLTAGDNIDWQAYVIAGAVAVLPIVIAWLNPADPRFGKSE